MRKRGSLYRRLAAIMLVLAMLFGMTGCRLFRKSKAEQAVEYMNAKYDDEFTFKSYASGDSRSYVFLSSKKFPNANIQANCSRKKDGTCYDFIDNYVYCKYEDQTREFLQDFFEDVFECEVKVKYDIGTDFNKDLTNGTTFDEFIHNSKVGIIVMVSNKCILSDKEIEACLKDEILKEGLILRLTCEFPSQDLQFEKGVVVDSNGIEEIKIFMAWMKNKNEFSTYEWRNIK